MGWPDSEDWCKAWLADQCAPPSRPPAGRGLADILRGGGIPIPGMTNTIPKKPPTRGEGDPKELDGRKNTLELDKDEEHLESDEQDLESDEEDATTEEVIRYVDCNLHRQCGCDKCSPVDCIVHAEDQQHCMWLPSQDFCVKW